MRGRRAPEAGTPASPGSRTAGTPPNILELIPHHGSEAHLLHVVPVSDGRPGDRTLQVKLPSPFLSLVADEPVFLFHPHQQILKDTGQDRWAQSPDVPLGDCSRSQHWLPWPQA